MAEGFRFVMRMKPIRALLLLLGCISLLALPYSVLMPIFADKILHGGARAFGILMGAAGCGALGGALTLAMRTGVRGLGRWIAISCAAFGTSLILFSFSRYFWLSVILLIPVGYSVMLQTSASNTLLQTMSPDNLRGRVLAVYSMMFMGMAPNWRAARRNGCQAYRRAAHGGAGRNRRDFGLDLVCAGAALVPDRSSRAARSPPGWQLVRHPKACRTTRPSS